MMVGDDGDDDDHMEGNISPNSVQPTAQARALIPMGCGEEREIKVEGHLKKLAANLKNVTTNVARDKGRVEWTNDWWVTEERSRILSESEKEADVSDVPMLSGFCCLTIDGRNRVSRDKQCMRLMLQLAKTSRSR